MKKRLVRCLGERRGVIILVLLPLVILIQGCTAGYKLKEYVEAGRIDDASRVYNENHIFFAQHDGEFRADLGIVAHRLNTRFASPLRAAEERISRIEWPAPEPGWPDLRDRVSFAKSRIAEYESHLLLADPRYRAPAFLALQAKFRALSNRMVRSAPARFAAFDHFGGGARFFDLYPVALDDKTFLNDNFHAIRPRLAKAATPALSRFLADYPKDTALGHDNFRVLSDLYLKAAVRENENRKRLSFARLLKALGNAKAAGFEPGVDAGYNIAVVVVRDFGSERRHRFSARYLIDLPAREVQSAPGAALSKGIAKTSDYLVIIKTRSAGAERRLVSVTKVFSSYLSGYRNEPNPDYRQYELDLRQAENDFAYLDSNRSEMPSRGLLLERLKMAEEEKDAPRIRIVKRLLERRRHVRRGLRAAKEKVDFAIERLRNTPQTVEVPIHAPYEFERRKLEVEKRLEIGFFIVDRKVRNYFKASYGTRRSKRFDAIYGLHENDIDRPSQLSGASSENDIASWEGTAMPVPVSALTNHYLANVLNAQPLPPQARIIADIRR